MNDLCKKVLTFSFDDGVVQDVRLIRLLDKYGMKATFNLSSGWLGGQMNIVCDGVSIPHIRNKPADVRYIYEGHEVAAHTLDHPLLPSVAEDAEVVRQVEEDRQKLSQLVGYEVVGMAYPGGGKNHDDRIAGLVQEHTGIRYARTVDSSFAFELPADLYRLKPSVYSYRQMDEMFQMGERFLALQPKALKVFYVWGHAYELDIRNDWLRFESFLEMMSSRKDICYCTNKEALLCDRSV